MTSTIVTLSAKEFSQEKRKFKQKVLAMLRTSLTTEASKTEMRNRGQSKVSEDRVIIISNSENGIEGCLWGYKENGSYIPYCIAASKGDREKLHKQLIETLQTL